MSRQEHQDDIFRNLDEVFTKRIVAIGENHEDIVPKKFLAQNAVFLRSRGYNTVLFEHLSKGHNETLRQLKFPGNFTQYISSLDIRNIVARAKSKFPGQEILDIDIENDYPPEPFTPFEKLLFNIFQSDFGHTYHENEQLALQEYHEILTNDQSNKFNFLKVVKELLTNGVNVVGIENSQTIYRSQAGNVRAKHLNASIVYSLGQFLSTTAPAQKAIVFVGNTHLQRHQDYPIPGISCPIELASLQQEDIQDYFRSRVIGYKKLFEDSFFPQLIDNLPEQALDAPPVRGRYSTPPPEETYWPVVSLDNARLIQKNISSISFFQTRRGAGTFERDLIFINTTPREIMEFGTSRLFAERIVCLDREKNLKIEGVGGLVGFLRRIDDQEQILLGYGNCEELKILYQRDRDKATHSSGEAASLEGVSAAAMHDDETSGIGASEEVVAAAMDDDEPSGIGSSEEVVAAAMHADEPSGIGASEEVAAETSMISRVPKRTSSSTSDVEEEAVFDEATSVEDGTSPKKARLDTPGKALGSGPLRLKKGAKNLDPRLDPGDSRGGPPV